jgi:predicted  nucleic acid-binding Zn-ribbon protein
MAISHEARDDEEKAAIQAILGELPEDHPAREAYKAGADTIQLTYLVDREDLVEKLNQAWLERYSRRLRRQRRGIVS